MGVVVGKCSLNSQQHHFKRGKNFVKIYNCNKKKYKFVIIKDMENSVNNRVLENKIFLAKMRGEECIIVKSRINKDRGKKELFYCPNADCCIHGSQLRQVCKRGLVFVKKCEEFDEILSRSEIFGTQLGGSPENIYL